jgi:phage head maturation protease
MVMSPIERGDVDQMSFGFRILDEAVLETKGLITITLRELDLIEVSPVAIPAYTDTEIALSARSSDRIEEFRARYTSESSVQHGHASEDAPVDMCHLDEELRLQWERELEDMAA